MRIQLGDPEYKRRLLSEDRWTISKAIALLLKGSVPEEQIVEMALRRLGRHIASSDDAFGGGAAERA